METQEPMLSKPKLNNRRNSDNIFRKVSRPAFELTWVILSCNRFVQSFRPTECFKVLTHARIHLLLVLTFLGVLLGVILGFSLRSASLSHDTIMLISFPGDILMRMLKMLILPLITSSLITGQLAGLLSSGCALFLKTGWLYFISPGVAVLDPKSSGKIGLYAISYYLLTTVLAAILGIILVVSIKPGNKETKDSVGEGTAKSTTTTQDAIMDLIR